VSFEERWLIELTGEPAARRAGARARAAARAGPPAPPAPRATRCCKVFQRSRHSIEGRGRKKQKHHAKNKSTFAKKTKTE